MQLIADSWLVTARQPIAILMATVLLGYIDRYIASKNIMLVTFHYVDIRINTSTCSKTIYQCEAIYYAFFH